MQNWSGLRWIRTFFNSKPNEIKQVARRREPLTRLRSRTQAHRCRCWRCSQWICDRIVYIHGFDTRKHWIYANHTKKIVRHVRELARAGRSEPHLSLADCTKLLLNHREWQTQCGQKRKNISTEFYFHRLVGAQMYGGCDNYSGALSPILWPLCTHVRLSDEH